MNKTLVRPSMTLPLRTSSTRTSVSVQSQARLMQIEMGVNQAFLERAQVVLKAALKIKMITSTRSLCMSLATPERGSREIMKLLLNCNGRSRQQKRRQKRANEALVFVYLYRHSPYKVNKSINGDYNPDCLLS